MLWVWHGAHKFASSVLKSWDNHRGHTYVALRNASNLNTKEPSSLTIISSPSGLHHNLSISFLHKEQNRQWQSKIWAVYRDEYSDSCLLGCDTTQHYRACSSKMLVYIHNNTCITIHRTTVWRQWQTSWQFPATLRLSLSTLWRHTGSGGTALLVLKRDTWEFVQLHTPAILIPANNHYALNRSYSAKKKKSVAWTRNQAMITWTCPVPFLQSSASHSGYVQ